jgi:HAD superfamily hydrolase (TIGR01549 family)
MIRGVIFDLDGTITRPVLDFAVIREEIGFPLGPPHLLARIETLSGPEQERAWAILHRHEEAASVAAELNEGGEALFAFLTQEQIPRGVVTRNHSSTARRALDKLGLHCAPIIARDSGLPVKPSGEPVRFICRHWGLKPGEVLMAGDYQDDVWAGKAAGALTVYLENGRPGPAELPADFRISRLDEMIGIITASRNPERSAQ